jgi:hypothetical protein
VKRRFLAFILCIPLLAGCTLSRELTPPPGWAEPLATQSDTGQAVPTAEPPRELLAVASGQAVWGRISNGTTGELASGELQVTLHGLDGEQEVLTQHTLLGEDALFLFSDLEAEPGRQFLVSVEYEGVVYQSGLAQLPADGAPLDLSFAIYETTSDSSALFVDRIHVVLEPGSENILRVLEVWVVSNLGERTVVAADGEGCLQISLPSGATDLSLEDDLGGVRFISTADGFMDTAPIRPGTNSLQLVFTFQLPYAGALRFSQPLHQEIGAVIILATEDTPRLTGGGFQDAGLWDMGGMPLQRYDAGPFAVGETLRFRVTAASGSESQLLGPILGGALLALAIGVVLWWFWKHRLGETGVTAEEGRLRRSEGPEGGGVALDETLEAIAALDDARQAGDISEEEYAQRRAALKARALQILRGQDD